VHQNIPGDVDIMREEKKDFRQELNLMIAKGFPCIIIHAGECGHVVSLDFTLEDLNSQIKWSEITESIRKHLLLMEGEYKKKYDQSASIFRFKEIIKNV
jgi:hypothetical protein